MTNASGMALCPWLEPQFGELDTARQRGQLGHAWLLTGPPGVGKANLALVLASRLLAGVDEDPAVLTSPEASALADARPGEDRHPDLHRLSPEPDKRSITVEQVREALGKLELTSFSGAGKVLVVEPAEAMTLAAANALLKTLEEPTANTYFFLLSHQPGRLPATIRSRCQVLGLPAPQRTVAERWLQPAAGGIATEELRGLLAFAGGAPLRALALIGNDFSKKNKELEDYFNQLSNNRGDAHALADEWLKGDTPAQLDWLATRLEWEIKRRLAPHASTSVTDIGSDTLHNSWRGLTLAALFGGWKQARELTAQVGSGANIDLALRVLMLEFCPRSGRP